MLYKSKPWLTHVQFLIRCTGDIPAKDSMRKAITYYRVSTDRQGESKLGLEAQEKAVKDFVRSYGYEIIDNYIEVESGRLNERPLLHKALRACEREKAVLLIAKLDRLSRSVAFITTLMEAGIEFKAIDYPDADKVFIQLLAVFAEFERDQNSKRTTAALRAAKKRGVELGKNGKYVLSKKNKANANAFANKMKPIIETIKKRDITTVRGITNELNRMRIPTYRKYGRKWYPNTVHQLIKRIDNLKPKQI